MKETLAIIDEMKCDGVIDNYAIGGAVGATFYIEPMATMDVDVFVLFPPSTDELLISLTPIYTFCKEKGFVARGEYIVRACPKFGDFASTMHRRMKFAA